jgi:hypothetical protein
MMGLMGNDIRHKVDDVGRDIAPGNLDFQNAACIKTCVQQSDHAFAASPQCADQFRSRHPPTIDAGWGTDSISSPDHLDPHASCVVGMTCEHADGASGIPGQRHPPQFIWKIFKEEFCHAITRIPTFDQTIAKNLFGMEISCHWLLVFVMKKGIGTGSGRQRHHGTLLLSAGRFMVSILFEVSLFELV